MVMLNNNLRIFITAAELGSLTETAKKLYVSQPAISHAIKKLEEELGVPLFVRNKRASLSLTEAGKDILVLAYQMADLENRMYQRAYDENHMLGGVVRIATVPLGASLILAPVLPEFRERFPQVQIEMTEAEPLEVKMMVQNYQADLGITTSPYLDLPHRTLLEDRIVSIHRDKAVNIDLSDPSEDLILCRVAYGSIMEQMEGKNIDLSHALVVEAASTQINMISNGNGYGVISEQMLSTIPNKLVKGTVSPMMEMEIGLITHDFDDLSSSVREMARMITEKAPNSALFGLFEK